MLPPAYKKNNAIVSAIAVHPNMTKDLLIELALNDNPYDNDETDYFYQTDKNPNIDSLLLKYSNLVEDIYVACLDELPEFITSTVISELLASLM
ncbi:MAG: hypothetical protein RL596_2530 [Bacteroidota bacterium]